MQKTLYCRISGCQEVVLEVVAVEVKQEVAAVVFPEVESSGISMRMGIPKTAPQRQLEGEDLDVMKLL